MAGQRGDRPVAPRRSPIRARPDGPSSRRVELTDSTFSTSGDYERFFIKDGVRYHHIIDPATGQPARLSRSVTIVAKRAVLADGLSTGVFLLGPDRGMALIERLPDVEGVIVGADNQVHVSSGLQGSGSRSFIRRRTDCDGRASGSRLQASSWTPVGSRPAPRSPIAMPIAIAIAPTPGA